MTSKPKKKKDLQQKENIKFRGTGLTTTEKRWGSRKFNEYKTRHHIDSLSDITLLEELVFREALQERYKLKIGACGIDIEEKNKKKFENNKPKTTSEVIPRYILTSLNTNLEQILILKDKLGLIGENRGDVLFKHIQTLKNKFKRWREENQGSRTLPCPHCSKMILLKIRTEAWEALKHPFFKDKILANKHLWKLHRNGTITKDDIKEILGISSDYIPWLEDKIYGKESK